MRLLFWRPRTTPPRNPPPWREIISVTARVRGVYLTAERLADMVAVCERATRDGAIDYLEREFDAAKAEAS